MEDLQAVPRSRIYRLLNHGPLVLVSTTDGEVPNACPVAWVMPAEMDPPRLALVLDPEHRTAENLLTVPECVVQIPTADLVELVVQLGTRSGHDGDKLGALSVATAPAREVRPPRLAACAAWIECRVAGTPEADGTVVLLLDALSAEVRPGALDERGLWDVARFPTLHHLGSHRFAVPGRVLAP
jgi:flavin reductase (DIM6/NTAB) family NADH-FMN oxidoreductase RutF